MTHLKKTTALLIIFILSLTVLAVSCKKSQLACTTDAKVCADGSVVGRDPENNCDFIACPEVTPSEGKLRAFQCDPEQRNAEVCTQEYAPVCGWFDAEKIQCFAYPCAQTYSNICGACSDEKVGYYTLGVCPKNNDIEMK